MMDGAPPQNPGDSAPPPPPPATPPPPAGPPKETPAPTSGGVVSDNRNLWIVLSYLGLLALIPLLVEKDDPEVQWHAKHGLVLAAVDFVILIGLWILEMLIGTLHLGLGGLGCILGLVWLVVMLAMLALHVMCIVKGLNGERLLIPGISEFADKF